MPATDSLYADLAEEARRQSAALKRRTPRAFDLREEVCAFFRELPVGDSRETKVGLLLDTLNVVVERGTDIDPAEEATFRQLLVNP